MTLLPTTAFQLTPNPNADRGSSFVDGAKGVISSEAKRLALDEIRSWPGYAATPLFELGGVARAIGVSQIWYKHEGTRFGLDSFKAMGGGYAVSRIVARHVMRTAGVDNISSHDLLGGKYRNLTSDVTVTCATDGNHGRAVAWAARLFGCRAVVYMASLVSESREAAIASFGAEVVRSAGNHEQASRECSQAAERNGWYVVSETEHATEPAIANDTFAGYSALLHEVSEQLPHNTIPTHMFVQAGVGGLAAASAIFGAERWGSSRPILVVVEAVVADCIRRSVEAGSPQVVTGELDTIMAGLAAGEVSDFAWSMLSRGADFAMAISDEAAAGTMRLLAEAPFEDPEIVGGESGVAGLAAALVAAQDEDGRRQLGLDRESRIVTIGTEGATDPIAYERLVGRPPRDVSC